MSYTRPNENRLADGTPTAGDYPAFTGTGTATWTTPGGGGSGSVVGFIAECNTTPTGGSPSIPIPFDTFYDIDFGTIAGPPAGSLLTYSGGVFTATADGFWSVNIGVDVTVNPGGSGFIRLSPPSFGYPPKITIAAAANPSQWVAIWAFPMRSGQTFSLDLFGTNAVDGYASLEIYLTATAISS